MSIDESKGKTRRMKDYIEDNSIMHFLVLEQELSCERPIDQCPWSLASFCQQSFEQALANSLYGATVVI